MWIWQVIESDGDLLAVKFKSTLPASFHHYMATKIEVEDLAGANHDTIPRSPTQDIQVWAAASALMNSKAVMDSCAHIHLGDGVERSNNQLHHDDYDGEPFPPGLWVSGCYFPQETACNMGPTVVEVENGERLSGQGDAGTWLMFRANDPRVMHRAGLNVTRPLRFRAMMRFMFHD